MKKSLFMLFVLVSSLLGSSGGASPTHDMTRLVIELGVILFAARAGGALFKRFNFPAVLGELVAGIIIGPYLLGALPFPGFPDGLFPIIAHSPIPVSTELYGIATIASIILLFMAGLETDLKLFLRFSFAGTVVGVGGVVFSFVIGDLTAVWLISGIDSFMHPQALFLGVMSTATSVGIPVRILSEKKKLDTPEGVTILAGAVIDDILGIILLAIVVGISTIDSSSGAHSPNWAAIGMIGVKAVGVWLLFTALGLLFAEKIAKLLRINGSLQTVAVMSLGLALLLAGIFEHAGLAMIIGAYVMGLTLSKTDLNFTIQEHLEPLQSFFVPIFFSFLGMLVNVRDIFTREALLIGGIYTVGAIAAKLIGSGIPALFLNFNRVGALRIGLGMVPRGEVALIIAGVGLANGILPKDLFSIAVVMTLVTTLVAPILLAQALSWGGRGTRKEVKVFDTSTLNFNFPSVEFTDLIEHKILQGFQAEGFMIHRLDIDVDIYNIQKEQILIIFKRENNEISIESSEDTQLFIRSLVYEMLVELNTVVANVKEMAKPEEMKRSLAESQSPLTASNRFDVSELLNPGRIIMDLKSSTKDAVIEELLTLLVEDGKICNLDSAKSAVMEREAAISTGMQYGLAIPHGRIAEVDNLHVAIGISQEGICFDSLDGNPSHVFVLTIVPSEKKVPYVQFLAAISSAMNSDERVKDLRKLTNKHDVISFFKA